MCQTSLSFINTSTSICLIYLPYLSIYPSYLSNPLAIYLIYISLCISHCISLQFYISIFTSIYIYLYLYLSIYLSIYLDIYLCICVSIHLCICVCLSVCPSIHLSICSIHPPAIHLSISFLFRHMPDICTSIFSFASFKLTSLTPHPTTYPGHQSTASLLICPAVWDL